MSGTACLLPIFSPHLPPVAAECVAVLGRLDSIADAAAHQLAIQSGFAIAVKNHKTFVLLNYMLIPFQLPLERFTDGWNLISIVVGDEEINDQAPIVDFAHIDYRFAAKNRVWDKNWLSIIGTKLSIIPANSLNKS